MLRVPLFTIARRAVLTSSKKVPSTVRIASARALSTKIYAVDAPDGEHDFQDREEHANGVGTIIGFAATTENAATIEAERAAGQAPPGVFAVDAPDGEHDLEELEEHKKAVDNIIDYAARFENAEEIDRMHETGKAKVFAVDAPDGEHDLKDLEEHAAGVNKIIDEAAFLENAEVVRKHQKMQEDTRNMVASFSSAP
uniref:Uncharacterized protein n=1 Tax=Odontella aurita TaxID=265563 RepID=A0A7S4N0I5_9STRA|mmetsp:Transcript_41941/g.127173  ORF Transcript_41941/g.127173 Transcript_41941/m.127173 type:complete len:197 (+) Transcript_41941:155-745(+)